MSKNASKGRGKKNTVPPKQNRFERAAAEVDRNNPRESAAGATVAAKAQKVLDQDEEIVEQQKTLRRR